VLGVPVLGAAAAPSPTVGEVRARIAVLHRQAEAATKRYDALREEIAGLNIRLDAARIRLGEAQQALLRARTELGR
jgi:hypothetical protein